MSVTTNPFLHPRPIEDILELSLDSAYPSHSYLLSSVHILKLPEGHITAAIVTMPFADPTSDHHILCTVEQKKEAIFQRSSPYWDIQ